VTVVLRNPRREVQVKGGRRVKDVLRELDILPDTVLIIRGDTMMTADQVVGDDDTIELRPVMSGGSAPCPAPASDPLHGVGRRRPRP
jgi:sulfur carrier protein